MVVDERLIKACVDACVGIPVEQLEALGVGGVNRVLQLANSSLDMANEFIVADLNYRGGEGGVIFKFRSKKLGGHYHTAVYSAPGPNYTFAKLGDIVLDERDFQALKSGNYNILLEEVDPDVR